MNNHTMIAGGLGGFECANCGRKIPMMGRCDCDEQKPTQSALVDEYGQIDPERAVALVQLAMDVTADEACVLRSVLDRRLRLPNGQAEIVAGVLVRLAEQSVNVVKAGP